MYAYAHISLERRTIKLTSFPSGNKLFAFKRIFDGLKGFSNSFTKEMSSFFNSLIDQIFALVYIDDTLLLSNSKEHMFQLIEQLHLISTKHNLKLASKHLSLGYSNSEFLDMKLVITQRNPFTQN